MRHLLGSWKEVEARLRPAPKIALFLDFDETLTRGRPTLQEASVARSLRQTLAALARCPRFCVCVASGRCQSEIRQRIRVPGIRYLDLQAWEARSQNGISESTHLTLEGVKSWVGGLFVHAPHVWIEDKGVSLAIHHHDHSGVEHVEEVVHKMVEPFQDQVRVAPARNVLEIVPLEPADKRAAVKHQMAVASRTAVPVYLGEHLMDESAFAALRRGVTVRVGRLRRTRARYWLADVKEAGRFLELLGETFT